MRATEGRAATQGGSSHALDCFATLVMTNEGFEEKTLAREHMKSWTIGDVTVTMEAGAVTIVLLMSAVSDGALATVASNCIV